MSMKWRENEERKEVSSPMSVIITAFAPVKDVRNTWTPQLRADIDEPTSLLFFDLANGKQRMGGSALAQVFKEIGAVAPDVEDAAVLKAFFQGCQAVKKSNPGMVLAYHDRSDGGLFTTIVEMAFAGRVGVEISLDALHSTESPIATLFNEELGAVLQVRQSQLANLIAIFNNAGFPSTSIHVIGRVNASGDETISIIHEAQTLYSAQRGDLQKIWSETSYRMQRLRDNSAAADEEYALITDKSHTRFILRPYLPPRARRRSAHATQSRHSPRTGGQRPGRDGVVVHRRWLRRPSMCTCPTFLAALSASPPSAALPPAVGSPTATSSAPAKAGPTPHS